MYAFICALAHTKIVSVFVDVHLKVSIAIENELLLSNHVFLVNWLAPHVPFQNYNTTYLCQPIAPAHHNFTFLANVFLSLSLSPFPSFFYMNHPMRVLKPSKCYRPCVNVKTIHNRILHVGTRTMASEQPEG